MTMEKYGVVREEKPEAGTKMASAKCTHPPSEVCTDDGVRFCMKCQKYLEGGSL